MFKQQGRRVLALAVLLLCAQSCKDEPAKPGPTGGAKLLAGGATPCDDWSAIAEELGCAMPDSCSVPSECEAEAGAWIECIADDLDQCLCEAGDGDLNCEGSYKDNEGPARCKVEAKAMRECEAALETD